MTALVTWSPFRELDLIERNMRRMMDDTRWTTMPLPAADVYETEEEFVVELEVPGYAEKELGIEVSDHVLTVKGSRITGTDEEDKTFRLHERLESEFERRFKLPPEANSEKLSAIFKQGVLEVHAPKTKELVPRKIPIKT